MKSNLKLLVEFSNHIPKVLMNECKYINNINSFLRNDNKNA